MRVELLYFDGCPHWKEADVRIREALRAAGRADVEVVHVLVSTPEAAEERGFLGSPTIVIDGRDPFAEPGASVGVSCRLYRTSAGPARAPTVPQLIEALGR